MTKLMAASDPPTDVGGARPLPRWRLYRRGLLLQEEPGLPSEAVLATFAQHPKHEHGLTKAAVRRRRRSTNFPTGYYLQHLPPAPHTLTTASRRGC
eukprot:COSAG01_NODE_294_length_19294_cov_35.559312_10_plen_96_part_00